MQTQTTPSANLPFALDPGAIVLAARPTTSIRWCGERYYAEDRDCNTMFTAGRHYGGICAPYWVGCERRRDAQGRLWETQNINMVMDNFGDLIEVPR